MSPPRDLPALKKEFTDILTGIAGNRKLYTVFSNWLELAAVELHQVPYHAGDFDKDAAFQDQEAKYLAVAKTYKREELDEMGKLLGVTMLALQLPNDFLGELYMDLGFSSERKGQFFTPYHLSRGIAQMNLGNLEAQIQEKGILRVADPACGAGGMLIATAEECISQGFDPRQVLQFEATDVDRDCANMTYIQLSAMDLQAMVWHGNSLSNEMFESRPTPQLRYFEQWLEQQRAPYQQAQKMLEILRSLDPPREDPQSQAPDPKPSKPSSPADITFMPEQLSLFQDNDLTN